MRHLIVTVADTAELLDTHAYGAGALLRWEWSPDGTTWTEGGIAALVSGTSDYDVWHPAGIATTEYRTRVSDAGGTIVSDYSEVAPAAPAARLLTVDQFREHVTTTLPDAALQTLLDAAEAAILDVVGAPGAVTEYVNAYPSGGGYAPWGLTHGYKRISVGRPIGTITSVTEYLGAVGDPGVILDTTDYLASGYVLTRLPAGAHPQWTWAHRVVVVYVPADDMAERQRVQLELVKLDLAQNPGLASQSIGTWSETYTSSSAWNYEQERDSILATLGSSGGMVVVE